MSALTPSPAWHGSLRRLIPLWRHAVWVVALFALVLEWVDVRVETQQLRADLRRSESAHREALEENEHLQLELDARHRALAMEAAGAELGLTSNVTTTIARPHGAEVARADGGAAR